MGPASTAVILVTDQEGYVVNRASTAAIPASWVEPVNSTVEAYRTHLGDDLHSVYLRGSVPLGNVRDFVSDVDTFAIVARPERRSDVAWADKHSAEVTRSWPFVSGVEAVVYPLTTTRMSGRLAAIIKVQSVCIYGQDLGPDITGFRPGIDLLFHAWDLPRDLAVVRHLLAATNDQEIVDKTCVWIMKRVVRSGFELVMERAGCYTRDLEACCEMFRNYYPAKAALIEEALSLAIVGRCDRERCGWVIEGVEDWLYPQICEVYGSARIEQLMANRS